MPTHHIISMERGATKNSGSPMWRCETQDGERVNVFSHSDPNKDNSRLFFDYLDEMHQMSLGEKVTWIEYPIGINMQKSGQWWDVKSVEPRPAGAVPDIMFTPPIDLCDSTAQVWARDILDPALPVVIIDLETTGTNLNQDEIVQLAVIDTRANTLICSLVKPNDPDRLLKKSSDGISPYDINGIHPNSLINAPTFKELYPRLKSILDGKIWLIYNSNFDATLLERACLVNLLPPFAPLAVADVMHMFAKYCGMWNKAKQNYTWYSLSTAAELMELHPDHAHDALADCLTTLEIIRALEVIHER